MTLKKLTQIKTWEQISPTFLAIYPEAEKNMEGYKSVFEKLLAMDSEKMEMSIVITTVEDSFDGEEYIDVSGRYNHPKNQEENYSQGLEFTPWRKWLGMDISQKSLEDFSKQEIIVHCLYEMTFEGFSEKHIQEVISRSEK